MIINGYQNRAEGETRLHRAKSVSVSRSYKKGCHWKSGKFLLLEHVFTENVFTFFGFIVFFVWLKAFFEESSFSIYYQTFATLVLTIPMIQEVFITSILSKKWFLIIFQNSYIYYTKRILRYLFLSLIKLPRGTTLELWLSAQSSHSHTISNEAHLLGLGGQYSFQTNLALSVNLYENGTSLCQTHLQYADIEICMIIFWININVTPDKNNSTLFINYKQSLPQSGIYGTLGNIRNTIVVLVPVPVMLSYWNETYNKVASVNIH